jgi:PPOX class probable F420-dependent enzyme
MDAGEMRQRVAEARVARLGTVTAEGHPHLVPCCFALDGDVVYTAVDEVKSKTTRALRRLENIRLRPAVSLLVDHYDDDWSTLWWIRMDGDASIADEGSPDEQTGLRLLVEKYEPYRNGRLSGPVITIAITRWRAWP